jgi:hypothetical protein
LSEHQRALVLKFLTHFVVDLPSAADYLAAGRAHVERRLAQAGLRLAALLNRSFCPGEESR